MLSLPSVCSIQNEKRISYMNTFVVYSAFVDRYVRTYIAERLPLVHTTLCLPSLAYLGCFHQEVESGFAGYARLPYSKESVSQLVRSCGQSADRVRMLCRNSANIHRIS